MWIAGREDILKLQTENLILSGLEKAFSKKKDQGNQRIKGKIFL
jgi:hypothetical protein